MIINVFGILLIMAKEDYSIQQPLTSLSTQFSGTALTNDTKSAETTLSDKERLGYGIQNHWYFNKNLSDGFKNVGATSLNTDLTNHNSLDLYKKQSLPL